MPALSYLFIALAILSWGLWGFWGKLALERAMPPASIFMAEGLMGFLLAAGLLGVLRVGRMSMPWNHPWNLYGFLSGAALAVGIGFYYLALEKGKVSVIVPVTATYPAVAVLLAVLVLGERLTGAQWLGMALTIAGCALLLSKP